LIIETDSNLYAHRSPPLPPVQATSGTALVAAVGSEEGQRANETLAEDEARFIDFEQSSLLVAEEHTFLDS